MKIIKKGRQEGKTTDLIKLSTETGAKIISRNNTMARSTDSIASDLGITIPKPISLDEFLKTLRFKKYSNGVIFDDVEFQFEKIIKWLINLDVVAASITTNDNPNKKKIKVAGNENIENVDSPLPLEVIPNYMGINLCSVDSIEYERQEDGQLKELTIKFIPA